LDNYLDAQQAVNGVALVDEQSETARALSKVFTAGILFDAAVLVPELAAERLSAFCREEYGAAAAGMADAILAADPFYRRGLAEISTDRVVVFVIR
jgi:hypothetical protein